MRRWSRAFPVVFAMFVLTIFVVPQYARAEVQVEQTATVNIQPYSGTYDEKQNIGNASMVSNRETWTSVPDGVFVGGVTGESRFEFSHYIGGFYGVAIFAQPVKFNSTQLASGGSEFYVRLPVVYNTSIAFIQFQVIQMNDPADYTISAGYHPAEDPAEGFVVTADRKIVDVNAVASIHPTVTSGGMGNYYLRNLFVPIATNLLDWSYVAGDRIYVDVVAPILTGQWYLFLTRVWYDPGALVQCYFSSGDVASDGVLRSTVEYGWVDGTTFATVDYSPIPADLGYSFVFTKGIGGLACSYDRYFSYLDSIFFTRYVPVTSATTTGTVNFDFEFGLLAGARANLSINVYHMNATGVPTPVLDMYYWYWLVRSSSVIASNGQNRTYEATRFPDGSYWQRFDVSILFTAPVRMSFVLAYDQRAPYDVNGNLTNNRMWLSDVASAGSKSTQLFFSPWMSLSIDPYSINTTWMPDYAAEPLHGLDHNWDFAPAEWLDKAGGFLVDLGGVAIASGIPGVTFLGKVAYGAGIMTQALAETGELAWDVVHLAFKMAIDGIVDFFIGIGKWLYKIAQWIYGALKWLVDQLINFGGDILALLIYGLAVLIPVLIITASTKLFSMFYKIAKGDLEGAAEEGRGLIKTATLGKYGGA